MQLREHFFKLKEKNEKILESIPLKVLLNAEAG